MYTCSTIVDRASNGVLIKFESSFITSVNITADIKLNGANIFIVYILDVNNNTNFAEFLWHRAVF